MYTSHIIFLLYILALCSGAVAITVSLLFFLQYHKKVIKYYSLLLMVVTLILGAKMVGVYSTVCALTHNPTLLLIADLLQRSGYALALFIGPFFAHTLIGIPYTRQKKMVFGSLLVIFVIATTLELASMASMSHFIKNYVSLTILFGAFLYLIILGALHLNKLGSKMLNLSLKITLVATIMIFPFALMQYILQKPYIPGFMEIPLSFLFINIASIVFAFTNFNQPAYYENNTISTFFKDKFQITEREQQIIAHVLQGSSNNEISIQLFISPRTVESHLYRIFQKMAISNRMQLVNLILSNKKE